MNLTQIRQKDAGMLSLSKHLMQAVKYIAENVLPDLVSVRPNIIGIAACGSACSTKLQVLFSDILKKCASLQKRKNFMQAA